LRLLLAAVLVAAPAAALGFDLQGHRGARGLAPENTLAGFAEALRIGVTTLELDLAMTQDGVLVASHDPALNPDIARDAAGAWVTEPRPVIRRMTFEALQAFDVGRLRPGSTYASRHPEQRPVDGARIPRLSEAIALAKRAGGDVRLNIELKTDPRAPDLTPAPEAFADAVVAELRAAGIARLAAVQSFDWRSLVHIRRTAPEFETVCLTAQQRWLDNLQVGRPGPSPWTAGLDVDDHGGSAPRLAKAAGCAVWSPNFNDLTAGSLAEARELGLKTIPWTANEPAELDRLIAMGVDGLITDRPDLARQAIAKAGLPLPPQRAVAP
jgi:glycerophosphoryl diester phosphodiesterase